MRKRWVWVIVAVVAAGGAALWLSSRRAKAPAAAPDRSVAVAERRDLEISAEAAGLVEPIRVVEVKSKASGEVLRVGVDTGDRVEAGALLAEIDPRDVQSALEQAQADLQSARVKAEVTGNHRSRMEQLKASATVTQQEYEAAVDAAASARAAVVRSETALRLARERRGDVTIRAPIAGTLLTRDVQPGQIIASATSNVSGGTTLFKMADLTEMQVRAKVDESDVGRVAAGLEAEVTVEAYPGRTFAGAVAKVEPQAVVEQNVTLFPVLIRVENREGLLRPGMNAEVRIRIARREGVVAVPSTAVVALKDAVSAGTAVGVDEATVRAAVRNGGPAGPGGRGGRGRRASGSGGAGGSGAAAGAPGAGEGGGPGLLFVRGEGGVEPRRVTLGLSDWEHTEIVEGLAEGERVVVVAVAQLQREQQQTSERFRQRMGGVVPGAGGGARPPRAGSGR